MQSFFSDTTLCCKLSFEAEPTKPSVYIDNPTL